MGILYTILSVFFAILCFFIVIIILLQTDKNSGMGILGGSSQSTFGSSTADVITKITAVMVAMFFVFAMLLAYINRANIKSIDMITSDPAKPSQIQEKDAPKKE